MAVTILMKGIHSSLLLLVTLLQLLSTQAMNVTTPYDSLFDDLMSGYKATLPVTEKTPLDLSLFMHLLQIIELDGRNQVLSTSVELTMHWNDVHLVWNPEDYGGIMWTTLPASLSWLPQIGLINSVGVVRDDNWEQFFPVIFANDGNVYWKVTAVFHSSCTLDMQDFPFDVQKCKITIGNLVHGVNMVNLIAEHDEIDLEFYTESKEFELLKRTATRTNRSSRSLPGYVIGNIEFELVLQRKPAYFILNLLVPCLVLSILACVPFSIPVNAGEKLSISITILLSFSVFLIVLSDITPRTSEHVPTLSVYLAGIMVITGLSLICTVVTLNIHYRDPARPIPPLLYEILINKLGRMLHLTDSADTAKISPTASKRMQINQKTHLQEVDLSHAVTHEACHSTTASWNHQTAAIDSIEEILHQMAKSKEEDAKEEKQGREWHLAARVLDRLFFIVYMVIVGLATMSLLITYPLDLAGK